MVIAAGARGEDATSGWDADVKDLDDVAQVLSVAAFAALARGPTRDENPDRSRARRWIQDLESSRRNPDVSRADGRVAELSNQMSEQIRVLGSDGAGSASASASIPGKLREGLLHAQREARQLGIRLRNAHESAAKTAVGILRLAVRRCNAVRSRTKEATSASAVETEAAAMREVLAKSRQTHQRDLVRLAATMTPLARQAETVLRDLPAECAEAGERADEAAEIGRSMSEIPTQRAVLSEASERLLGDAQALAGIVGDALGDLPAPRDESMERSLRQERSRLASQLRVSDDPAGLAAKMMALAQKISDSSRGAPPQKVEAARTRLDMLRRGAAEAIASATDLCRCVRASEDRERQSEIALQELARQEIRMQTLREDSAR